MAIAKLTDKGVKAAASGRYGDGGGLYLVATKAGSKSWVFRFTLSGKASETGLGGYPAVSLAKARELAASAREKVAAGINPAAARKAEKAARAASGGTEAPSPRPFAKTQSAGATVGN